VAKLIGAAKNVPTAQYHAISHTLIENTDVTASHPKTTKFHNKTFFHHCMFGGYVDIRLVLRFPSLTLVFQRLTPLHAGMGNPFGVECPASRDGPASLSANMFANMFSQHIRCSSHMSQQAAQQRPELEKFNGPALETQDW